MFISAMSPFLFLIFALYAGWNTFMMGVSGREISYEDIRKANFSCYPRDTCAVERASELSMRHSYHGFIRRQYACRCDRLCSKLGTCCIDSPYRDVPSPAVKPSCRRVDDTLVMYYVVDKCGIGGHSHPNWKKLCEKEPERVDDLKMIAHVTSLSTSMTYKNYYCLRCHETTNDFLYWKVKMTIQYTFVAVTRDGIPNTDVVYDKRGWKEEGADGESYYVTMGFQIPESIESLGVLCDRNMISNCSEKWTNEDVRNLCSAYTAIVYTREPVFNRLVYKNVHCALCNFESLEDLECVMTAAVHSESLPRPFHCVFNVNLEGNKGECGRDGPKLEWDDKQKKVRVLHCIVPGYVVKDGKCVPPMTASSA